MNNNRWILCNGDIVNHMLKTILHFPFLICTQYIQYLEGESDLEEPKIQNSIQRCYYEVIITIATIQSWTKLNKVEQSRTK